MDLSCDSLGNIKETLDSIAGISKTSIKSATQSGFLMGIQAGVILQNMLNSNNVNDFERNLLDFRNCFKKLQIDLNVFLSEEAIQELRSRCMK